MATIDLMRHLALFPAKFPSVRSVCRPCADRGKVFKFVSDFVALIASSSCSNRSCFCFGGGGGGVESKTIRKCITGPLSQPTR